MRKPRMKKSWPKAQSSQPAPWHRAECQSTHFIHPVLWEWEHHYNTIICDHYQATDSTPAFRSYLLSSPLFLSSGLLLWKAEATRNSGESKYHPQGLCMEFSVCSVWQGEMLRVKGFPSPNRATEWQLIGTTWRLISYNIQVFSSEVLNRNELKASQNQ